MKISVVMIARDSATSIRGTVESLRSNRLLLDDDELLVVDTGSTDGTPDVVRDLGGRCIERPDLLVNLNGEVADWLPGHQEDAEKAKQVSGGVLRSFSEARNIATDNAENDIQFWIDADDVFHEDVPGKLRDVVEKELPGRDLGTIFLDYDYAHDEHGRCVAVHKRERVFDRRRYVWKGPCHEVLIPRDGVDIGGAGYFHDLKSRIVHKKPRSDSKSCNIRNYLILRAAVEREEKEHTHADTRLYFYLANACSGLKLYREASELYQLTLKRSGSRDDCFHAAHSMAMMNMEEGRISPAQALHWAHEAIKIKPSDPRGYYLVQHANYLLRRFEESLWWFEVGKQLPEPRMSLNIYNPEQVNVTPYIVAALSFKELGDSPGARECAEHLKRVRPDSPDVAMLTDAISQWQVGKNLGSSIYSLVANMALATDEQRERKIKELAGTVKELPSELEDRGVGVVEGPDEREGEDLVFFCGKTQEDWGPKSAKRGLGGSERAAYEVSRRMATLGFRVTVYCSCPKEDRGEHEGVLWHHWSEFDKKRARGTVVYWRMPEMLELPFAAEKRIVWCHDVQSPANWTKARVALVDSCMVLSEYHKTTLGGRIPDDRVLVTRNGIDDGLIRDKLSTTNRNPKKVIFTSSPDRGVLTSLRAFQIAQEEDPDLEFHMFYGFTKLFLDWTAKNWAQGIPDLGHEMCATEYMRLVQDTIDTTPNAVNHGRVGWDEMAEHFATAGVWMHPTRFHEISCIGAMEAQAAGCCVVASDFAALKETVDWESELAFKVSADDTEQAAYQLVLASRVAADDPRRTALSDASLEKFSWDGVCREWAQLFSTQCQH